MFKDLIKDIVWPSLISILLFITLQTHNIERLPNETNREHSHISSDDNVLKEE